MATSPGTAGPPKAASDPSAGPSMTPADVRTATVLLVDDVPEEEKEARAQEIMDLQQDISLEKNQEKIGKVMKVMVDKKESGRYIGRTEFDSVEVDNEVIINSKKKLHIGEFVQVKITKAFDYDLEGEVKDIYQFTNNTAFSILQATRTRISKTEYISCPSCGRTLFDLQETTAKIRAVTNHLKGLKIAIMGCIVNGPGEMADADFGYVGSGPGKITLYKGKEVMKRNVNSEVAVEELINLIKENGAWVEE